MAVSATTLNALLTDPAFVDELHAFLWTEPFLNRDQRDGGWSCRDHAVVVGAVLQNLGAAVSIRHGRCMFVLGPEPDGHPPVGIGQDSDGSGAQHSWLHVGGYGDVDLSPKLSTPQERWRAVLSPGIVGSEWIADRPTSFYLCAAPSEYDQVVAKATHAESEARAIYAYVKEERFTSEIAESGLSWANSRVSLRQRNRGHGEDLFVRLGRHLIGVERGTRKSLAKISTNKAWSLIASDRALSP